LPLSPADQAVDDAVQRVALVALLEQHRALAHAARAAQLHEGAQQLVVDAAENDAVANQLFLGRDRHFAGGHTVARRYDLVVPCHRSIRPRATGCERSHSAGPPPCLEGTALWRYGLV
jgi:GR25 family glycosyltransferase involved in LPS biosynthesis